jgi:hypothetical protein
VLLNGAGGQLSRIERSGRRKAFWPPSRQPNLGSGKT